ncbi:MAG: NAD-dependent epimerase/dehydratase family protein [Planctomycetes bacterium]|nr:NAD-dependent epimerase/dehydratase family protein [Planctomycetota bacterium]
MKILITGAAGNLGAMLARHLLAESDHVLRLMVHKTPPADDLVRPGRTHVHRCDLADPQTLVEACAGTDVVVHFAGVLFAPGAKKFLPTTNVEYVRNLMEVAGRAGVKRFIIVSFPHVEGPTSASDPCTDRQDRDPISVHARTRLEAERLVFRKAREFGMRAISLRAGMIYGRDVLMIAFARKLAGMRLLAVWRDPTPVHLISIDDFNACCQAAIEEERAGGFYPLGDDDPTTLQEFMDACCVRWGVGRPWRVPVWSVYSAAWVCESFARIFGTRTPFHVDFIRIGRVPYYCDTRRMREELRPRMKYPSWRAGLEIV